MEVLCACCCGIDVHAKTVVACLITQGEKEIRTFSTMTADVLGLLAWLTATGCTHVAIDSTGVYWKPVFNLLEGASVFGTPHVCPASSSRSPSRRIGHIAWAKLACARVPSRTRCQPWHIWRACARQAAPIAWARPPRSSSASMARRRCAPPTGRRHVGDPVAALQRSGPPPQKRSPQRACATLRRRDPRITNPVPHGVPAPHRQARCCPARHPVSSRDAAGGCGTSARASATGAATAGTVAGARGALGPTPSGTPHSSGRPRWAVRFATGWADPPRPPRLAHVRALRLGSLALPRRLAPPAPRGCDGDHAVPLFARQQAPWLPRVAGWPTRPAPGGLARRWARRGARVLLPRLPPRLATRRQRRHAGVEGADVGLGLRWGARPERW
jgi:hypothetical protein